MSIVEQIRDKALSLGAFRAEIVSSADIPSAVRIGLIPAELEGRVSVIGNAALAGASQLLLDKSSV